MDVVDQVNDLADSAEKMARRAGQTDTGKAAIKISDRLERVVGAKPANAAWRGAFLALAGAATVTSLGFAAGGKKHEALFWGQWVPTLLIVALWGQVIKD